MKKFAWTTLMVKDLDATIDFYEEVLGWAVTRRFPAGEGMEIAFMAGGETELEFICSKGKEAIVVGPDISWGFLVESLDDMLAFVKEKGIPIHSGPFTTGAGARYFYIQDPDGMKLQFFQD